MGARTVWEWIEGCGMRVAQHLASKSICRHELTERARARYRPGLRLGSQMGCCRPPSDRSQRNDYIFSWPLCRTTGKRRFIEPLTSGPFRHQWQREVRAPA
jgi:hypothetical protein